MDKQSPFELQVNQDTILYFAHIKFAVPLFQLFQQEAAYLQPWLPWLKLPGTLKDTQRMLWEQQIFNQGKQRLTTFINYQGTLCGMIGFTRLDKKNQLGELGYWIAQDQQGNGIVTNCCKKIVEYGFDTLNLNRIEIRIPSKNERSLKIPPKLSFTFEGTLRQAVQQNGQYQDLKLFSLLREECNTKFLFQKI